MKDEAFYIERAKEARRTADRVRDDGVRQAWLEIAESYERLAASARTLHGSHPKYVTRVPPMSFLSPKRGA
jgi:hypothetical protein